MGLNTYSYRVFRIRLFTSAGNPSTYNITFTGFKTPKIEQCEGTEAVTPTTRDTSPQRSCLSTDSKIAPPAWTVAGFCGAI